MISTRNRYVKEKSKPEEICGYNEHMGGIDRLFCTQNKKRKETSYRCKECPEKTPLSPDCFEVWHKDMEYLNNE